MTNRTFNLLKQLRKEFRITVLAFSRRNHQENAAARERAQVALEEHGLEVGCTIPIPSERAVFRRLLDHTQSAITGRPYTQYEYRSNEFQKAIVDAFNRREFSMAHLDSLDLHAFLRSLPNVPITCTHHSIESELLRLRADRIRSKPVAAYIRHQADLVEHVERRLCPRFALNVMMSELDASRLRLLAPRSRTIAVPNGVDVDYMRPPAEVEEIPGQVAFLGPTYMFPNRDAVNHFLAESWDTVRCRVSTASLRLIGRSSEVERREFETADGVRSVGYAPDVRPHIAKSMCCIAPLRVGGGTRLKILDYWSMGKAVVSTSLGCEGLHAVDGENILIRDDPLEFADAVVEVLTDAELRFRLEQNARRTAVELYSWEIIGGHMVSEYKKLLAGSSRSLSLASELS